MDCIGDTRGCVTWRVLSPLQVGRVRHEPGAEVALPLSAGEIAVLIERGIVAPAADAGDDAGTGTATGTPAPAGGAGEGREARLLAAIAGLEEGNPDHWTQDGRPEVRALKAATGLADLTAAGRDAAWAAYREAREGAE